jgi:hypothetical protein
MAARLLKERLTRVLRAVCMRGLWEASQSADRYLIGEYMKYSGRWKFA